MFMHKIIQTVLLISEDKANSKFDWQCLTTVIIIDGFWAKEANPN